MRKKSALLLIVVSVIIVSLVLGFFITVKESRVIKIKGNFFNVLAELNSPEDWRNWQGLLKQDYTKDPSLYEVNGDSSSPGFYIKTSDHSFYVQKLSAVSFDVKEVTNEDTLFYNISVLSTVLPTYTNLVTTTRVNLFDYLLFNHSDSNAFSTANYLKSFIENPSAYYGYSFTIEKTIDTVVVVKETIVAKRNWQQELSSLYKSLYSFIDRNHLKIMQPKIVSFKPISIDSFRIRAGIPVNKVAPEIDNIRCLKMPKANILVGEYQGRYDKRTSLSTAMEKYIRDHSLDEIALPYEKFLNDSIPETDTSIVTIKMYYPVLN